MTKRRKQVPLTKNTTPSEIIEVLTPPKKRRRRLKNLGRATVHGAK